MHSFGTLPCEEEMCFFGMGGEKMRPHTEKIFLLPNRVGWGGGGGGGEVEILILSTWERDTGLL